MPYGVFLGGVFLGLLVMVAAISSAHAADDVAGPPAPPEISAQATGDILSPIETAATSSDYPEDFSTPEAENIAPVSHNAFGEDVAVPEAAASVLDLPTPVEKPLIIPTSSTH